MLEFKKVSKNFGSIKALDDISFKIKEGEFVFITGRSGAGKTTILRLVTREVKASSGEIFLGEQELGSLKNKQIPHLRQQIGAIFQDFKLLPSKTIKENAEVALAIKGVDPKEWNERVEHVLNLVGLGERQSLFPAQLSGGELQRAAIARALVINPDIVFADEPTGNLDWATTKSIVDLLDRISKEGKTVIVTTHNEDVVKKMGHRVIHLTDGKVDNDTGSQEPEIAKKTKNKK
jgi:cell division transport system ATP-binding protein